MSKRLRTALALFSTVTILSLLTAALPKPIHAAPNRSAALRSLDETLQQLQSYLRQVRPAGHRAGPEASLAVSILDDAFDVATIYVRPGDTVTWYNDGSADHAVQGGSPTAVIVVDFRALPQGPKVAVRWQTVTEADLVGFSLYRAADGGGRKDAALVTPEMIPAQLPGQPGGAAYEYTDAAPCGHVYTYWLEVHRTAGRIDEAGPAGPAAACASFQAFLPEVRVPPHGSRVPGTPQPSAPQAESWNSGTIHPGESYAHTFTELGTHPYYDPLHITLTGEVVVRPLALVELYPKTAQWGSYIYLSGTGFSADALSNTVVFSLTVPGYAQTVPFTASVVGASEGELVVIAPLPISGSVQVQVRVAGDVSNQLPFTATELFDPTPGEPGNETTGYWSTVITSVVDIEAGLEGSLFYQALTQLLSDTVELGGYEWQAGGLWHIVTESECAGDGPAFHSPASAWYYGRDGTCDYETEGGLTGILTMTRAITIPGNVSAATFSFWQYASTDQWGSDARAVDISTDGGQTWSGLWSCQSYSCYEPQESWYKKELDISAYISQSVRLRFRLTADGGGDWGEAHSGWFVDDIQLRTSDENAAALADFFAAIENDFAYYRQQLLLQEGPEELRLLDAVYSSDAFVMLMFQFDEISFLLAHPGETLGGGQIDNTTAADVLESLQTVIDILAVINTLLDGLRVMLYSTIVSLSATCALVPATCPATAGLAALLTAIVKVVEAIKQVVGPIAAILKLFSVHGVPTSLRVKHDPYRPVDQLFHDNVGRPITRPGVLYTGADFTVEAYMILQNDGLKRSASQILADLTAFSYVGAIVWIIGQMNIDLLFWVPQILLGGIHIRSEVIPSDPSCVAPFPKSPNPTVWGIQPTCLADVTIQGYFQGTYPEDMALTRSFEVLDRPLLESITPNHGRLGSQVVVRARGLEVPNSRAHFPAVPAFGAGGLLEPESMSFTAITGTLTDTLSGLVFVDALGRESDRLPFTVDPPLLTSFPPSVLLGTSEYLYGEGFSAVVDHNLLHLDTYTVSFGAAQGNGRLAFALPAADTFLLGRRSAWVTTLGTLPSNAVSTTVVAWSPQIDLFGDRETLRPALARAANGNVYVAAVERGPNDGTRVVVTSYLSGAVTMTTPAVAGVDLGGLAVVPERPAVAAGLYDNVHVAWVGKLGQDMLMVSTSTDGGQSFLGPVHVMLPGQPAEALPHDPAIAADDVGVYLAWTYETGEVADKPAVYFARSADGITFDLPQRLSAPGAAAMDPDLAVGPDGTVYAAWAVWHDGIYVASSHDLGLSFGTPVKVSDSVAESWHPAITAHAGCGGGGTRVAVTWQGERIVGSSYQGTNVPGRIWFAESSNGGSTFGQPLAVDGGPASLAPDVAYDDDCTAAVAWYVPDSADIVAYPVGCERFQDEPPATSLPWHGHVHLARKAPAAPGFGPGMALDEQTAGLAYPALAGAGSGGLYAAWQDGARQAYTTSGVVLRTTVEPWPVVSATVPAFSAPAPMPQRLIVWGEQDGGGLYMAWEDGSSARRLWHTEFGMYDTGDNFVTPPAWSPDGGWIAYPSASGTNTRRGLYIVQPDGDYPLLIAGQCTEAYGFGSLNWSPLDEQPGQEHSRVLAFDWGGVALVALDLDSAAALQTTCSAPARIAPDWDWSAGGYYDYIFLSQVLLTQDELILTEGEPLHTGLQFTYHPAWSPDGQQLVFCSPSNTEHTLSLYTAYADGSGLLRLTTGPAEGDHYPAWSPDGLSIAFVRGSGGLYVVPATGGPGDLLLSMSGTISPPAWSPEMP